MELTKEHLSRLDEDDLKIIESLSDDDINLIDSWLLQAASHNWQKVAMIVGRAILYSDKKNMLSDVPDVYFGIRIEKLVENCLLISEGDLSKMRSSEVKLAS